MIIIIIAFIVLSVTEVDFWRAPSRRLYVTRHKEYEELVTQQREKKQRLSLSLGRKRRRFQSQLEDEDRLSRIENIEGRGVFWDT